MGERLDLTNEIVTIIDKHITTVPIPDEEEEKEKPEAAEPDAGKPTGEKK